MIPIQPLIAGYWMFQGTAVLGGWVLLAAIPETRSLFHLQAWPTESLAAFALADGLFLGLGSWGAAVAVLRDSSHARACVWGISLLSWYPTLYCLMTSMLTQEAWLASGLMVGLSGVATATATMLGTAEQVPAKFRATPMTI